LAELTKSESKTTTHERNSAGVLSRYLAAAVFVRLADEGARVALVLLALDRLGSAGAGGVLVAALLIPHVVAAPGVGLLADRIRQPRWVITGAAAGFAASLAGVAGCLGRLPMWVSVIVLLLGGCCGPALTGGLTSQLSALVSEGSLPRAFGADSLGYNISGIAGPAMAALIAGLWQPTAALLGLAAAAGLGAALLATLPIPLRPAGVRRRSRLSGGMKTIVVDPVLRTVTAASSLGQLGFGALPVVAAVLASGKHQPAATGWLMAAVAVGGLLGSLLWTWRPMSPRRAPSVVMISLIGSGAALAVAAGVSSLPLAAVLFTASGVFIGPLTGALFTTRQEHATDEVRAQVFTIGAGLKTTSAAAGAALGGALAQLPITIQLLVTAGSPLLAGALGAVSLGIQRERETVTRGALPSCGPSALTRPIGRNKDCNQLLSGKE
jgi:MFS family permease